MSPSHRAAFSRPARLGGPVALAVCSPPSDRRLVQRQAPIASPGRGRRVRRLPRVRLRRRPTAPRLESPGSHRPGLSPALSGRDEPDLHAGARCQRARCGLAAQPRSRTGATICKLEYVQLFASALGHLIGRQQDQVGLADHRRRPRRNSSRPDCTPGHVARLLDEIEELKTAPVTRLGQGLRDLYRRLGRRGVLIVHE